MSSVRTVVCARWKGEDMHAKEAKKCVPGGRVNTERSGCLMCGQNAERRLPGVWEEHGKRSCCPVCGQNMRAISGLGPNGCGVVDTLLFI